MSENKKNCQSTARPMGFKEWYGPGSIWHEIQEFSSRSGESAEYLQILHEPNEDLVLVTAVAENGTYGNTPDMQSNEYSEGRICLDAQNYLEAVAFAQTGIIVSRKGLIGSDETISFEVGPTGMKVQYFDRYGPPAPTFLTPSEGNFLLLDSFSVIEDGYERKKDTREIDLSVVEDSLLNITSQKPEIIHSYSPRDFEYFVAALLTKIGFSKVTLSQFWNDSGRDIWATYCEGDTTHTVVVEVKHFSKRKVGIQIVDRLNGVRARMGATRGMVVTSSSFSKSALQAYESLRGTITLVDFERLVGLLSDSGVWHKTPSGLWTPKHHSHSVSEKTNNSSPL